MKKLIMIFIDGVGIGKKDKEINPFFSKNYDFLNEKLGELPSLKNSRISKNFISTFPINARMGIDGLPQSGTGQTSIFCGVNAQKIINQHFGPFPYSTLKPIIQEKNILSELIGKKISVTFVNAYPKEFFDYVDSGKKSLSVTTLSCEYAGIKLKNKNDLVKKRAISAEITNKYWIEKFKYKLDYANPVNVGMTLQSISNNFDFVLFEYFLTDHAGHSRDFHFAEEVLSNFDGLLNGLYEKMDFDNENILIVSDHGNIEDLSTKTHTLNPALGISIGKESEYFANKIKTLKDIKKTILEYYDTD